MSPQHQDNFVVDESYYQLKLFNDMAICLKGQQDAIDHIFMDPSISQYQIFNEIFTNQPGQVNLLNQGLDQITHKQKENFSKFLIDFTESGKWERFRELIDNFIHRSRYLLNHHVNYQSNPNTNQISQPVNTMINNNKTINPTKSQNQLSMNYHQQPNQIFTKEEDMLSDNE